ncbi:MAG: ribonuclease HII [Crocinitomicaceae bacterium]|nr:ribonuclease HII [Crocinitomicaceae bacterium]
MLKSFFDKKLIEVGCDEAGRGCLAGPVVAAAVILPKNFKNKLLNDSKKLTESQRNKLRPIIEKEAISWAVGIIYPKEIDKINILNASFKAMHKAIEQLEIKPELILVDGNRFNKYKNINHKCIIKGDSKYMCIAAASILAKTYRDDIMLNLHQKEPMYLWFKNKGYPTKEHRIAIKKYGATKYHRKTFTLLPKQN